MHRTPISIYLLYIVSQHSPIYVLKAVKSLTIIHHLYIAEMYESFKSNYKKRNLKESDYILL